MSKPHHVPAKSITAGRGTCPISPEKMRYSVRSAANKALTNARETFGSDHAIDVYRCKGCHAWHITHVRRSQWSEHRRRGAEA